MSKLKWDHFELMRWASLPIWTGATCYYVCTSPEYPLLAVLAGFGVLAALWAVYIVLQALLD